MPQPPDSTASEPSDLFPIRTVSSLTGVNPITLRAWERRHGLVRPLRTRSGHRLYRRADVDTIHHIVALLDKGVSIGQVSRSLPRMESSAHSGDAWEPVRREMIAAISQFDETRLEDAYNGAQSRFPDDVVQRQVLIPLLSELGERWASAVGSVAEEHFFSAWLRNKLGARFHHRSRLDQGERLIAACLPGEFHEAGLLLFCLAAHERGYRPVLLGADMPLDELPRAARRSHSAAIVLSGSARALPALFGTPLKQLADEADVPVMLGGSCALLHHEAILRAGAVPMGTDIPAALQLIADRLGTPERRT